MTYSILETILNTSRQVGHKGSLYAQFSAAGMHMLRCEAIKSAIETCKNLSSCVASLKTSTAIQLEL